MLSGLIVAATVFADAAAAALVRWVGLDALAAGIVVVAAAVAASLPLLIGLGRLARRPGRALAESALPRRAGTLDLEAAPRRALVLMLQLGVALATAVVVVAVTQPFLPSYLCPVLLFLLLVAFAIALCQSATDLQGHVRAGSQAIVEVL